MYNLSDADNVPSGFFVFPDVSVRMEGKYRLKFSLFEIIDGVLHYEASVFSSIFSVYTAKRFPGLEESTHLTRIFAEQGMKLRVRKEQRKRRIEAFVSASGIGVPEQPYVVAGTGPVDPNSLPTFAAVHNPPVPVQHRQMYAQQQQRNVYQMIPPGARSSDSQISNQMAMQDRPMQNPNANYSLPNVNGMYQTQHMMNRNTQQYYANAQQQQQQHLQHMLAAGYNVQQRFAPFASQQQQQIQRPQRSGMMQNNMQQMPGNFSPMPMPMRSISLASTSAMQRPVDIPTPTSNVSTSSTVEAVETIKPENGMGNALFNASTDTLNSAADTETSQADYSQVDDDDEEEGATVKRVKIEE